MLPLLAFWIKLLWRDKIWKFIVQQARQNFEWCDHPTFFSAGSGKLFIR